MRVSSPFGWRSLRGKRGFHGGTDYALPVGTPLLAQADATVAFARTKDLDASGLYVGLDYHELGIRVSFAHMERVDVRKGEKVKAGDVVGLSGNTGRSFGPHVHLRLSTLKTRWLDAELFIESIP